VNSYENNMFNKSSVSRYILGLILLLSAFLEMYLLWQNGYGNSYYATAVKSMTESWHNFFFVSFDPGGFISVDKPPLALWIQTLFAKIFGFSGFVILLPQAVAQVVAVGLIYKLVNKTSGKVAGLIAAFVLAITPINVALARTNEVDGILVLILVLAAWAFLVAVETKKLRYLFLSFAIIGLGFNTKMLEAYIALPAFELGYFLSSIAPWPKKIRNLILANVILLVVSFSWIFVVDMTPPSNRPYVGSSQTNSEFNLAIGYNGIQRITGMLRGGRRTLETTRPAATEAPEVPPRNFNRGGFGFNGGSPGPFRLFNGQYGSQISWLLAFALISVLAIVFTRRIHFPLTDQQLTAIFWGVWVASGVVVFSVAGTLHPYYTAIMGPAIAALVGIGSVWFWEEYLRNTWRKWLLPIALAVSVIVQVVILSYTPSYSYLLTPVIVSGSVIAVLFFVTAKTSRIGVLQKYVSAVCLASLFVLTLVPSVWAVYSTFHPLNTSMPTAGPNEITLRPGDQSDRRPFPTTRPPRGDFEPGDFGRFGGSMPAANQELIQYLEDHQGSTEFLAATLNSMTASPIILATGKPVMALGGFSGSDEVLTLSELEDDVKNNVVRYFLLSQTGFANRFGDDDSDLLLSFPGFSDSERINDFPGFQGRGGFNGQGGANSALSEWVTKTCKIVPGMSSLYDCVGE